MTLMQCETSLDAWGEAVEALVALSLLAGAVLRGAMS
jgi:hypothetical protein